RDSDARERGYQAWLDNYQGLSNNFDKFLLYSKRLQRRWQRGFCKRFYFNRGMLMKERKSIREYVTERKNRHNAE
ncbi:hypothetical protein, partial [Legionella hackeliae]|uniref:hypothetical protein n=1 Tax=Legionella hackeliae TaxID=449 RepID=UPI001ED9C016